MLLWQIIVLCWVVERFDFVSSFGAGAIYCNEISCFGIKIGFFKIWKSYSNTLPNRPQSTMEIRFRWLWLLEWKYENLLLLKHLMNWTQHARKTYIKVWLTLLLLAHTKSFRHVSKTKYNTFFLYIFFIISYNIFKR